MRQEDNTSFLDVIFISALVLLSLFVVSFLLIKPIIEKKADIETKAEFVITVTWPRDCPDDIDTWTRTPTGNLIWFRQKENSLCHLDRDDLGYKSDKITLPNGEEVIYPYNQEITTIRGFIPGEWVLNIHMYRKRSDGPTEVTVKIDKLNPVAHTILYKQFVLTTNWQEITVSRFTMGESDIISWDLTPAKLVQSNVLQ